MADSVVQKNLQSININQTVDNLSLCLAHDVIYITVVTSLIKPALLRLVSGDKLVKVTIKSSNGLQPMSVRFSLSKNYVFACYKNSIDILGLTYGSEVVPSLDRIDVVVVKESLMETYYSKTVIMPSVNSDMYLYYLYKGEEIKEEVDIPSLRITKDNTEGIPYNVKQFKIEGKNIVSRDIIRIELEDRVKCYEWTSNMEKLAIVMENNTIALIFAGGILKGSEVNDPKLSSKDYQKELLQFYSHKFNPSIPLKSVT